jgi:hypothetical protein
MSGGVGADRKRGRKATAPARYPITAERPHRTLRLETPEPTLRPGEGQVQCRPVLGGLHHVYERAA